MNGSELIWIGLGILTGLLIGIIFFGGLWWTVRVGLCSKRPALWFLTSWLIRFGVGLAGFYLVGAGYTNRFIGCLLGFVTARWVVGHGLRSAENTFNAYAARAIGKRSNDSDIATPQCPDFRPEHDVSCESKGEQCT
jgi:F1F0 ATPase subunit 2